MASPRWTVEAVVETAAFVVARDVAAALAEAVAETLDRLPVEQLTAVTEHGVKVACWTDHETAPGPVAPDGGAEAAVARARVALDAWRAYNGACLDGVRQVVAELDQALDGPAASDG